MARYLDGGLAEWDRAGLPLAWMGQVDVSELKSRLAEDASLRVLDVRRPGEYASGYVPGAVSFSLDRLARELDTL